MSRSVAPAFIAAATAILVSSSALAQPVPAAPRVSLMLSPGGSTIFTGTAAAPRFTNSRTGAALAVDLTRLVGLEGEFGASFGIEQEMLTPMPDPHPGHHLPPEMIDARSPDALDYSINVVVSIPTGGSVIPYLTGGVGGLTLLKRAEVSHSSNETFLTANAGAGVKWFSAGRRWGLRGDYRLLRMEADEHASAFFGGERRYAHRVYGGVFFALGR